MFQGMSEGPNVTVTEVVVIDEATGDYVSVCAPDAGEAERLLDGHPFLFASTDTPAQMGA